MTERDGERGGEAMTNTRGGWGKSRISPWTPERDQKLREMVAWGFCFREIGQELGFTKNAIVGRATRLGIKLPGRKYRSNRSKSDLLPSNPSFPWSYPPAGCCHWPIGDVKKPGFHFCGASPAVAVRPYCEKHDRRSRPKVAINAAAQASQSEAKPCS